MIGRTLRVMMLIGSMVGVGAAYAPQVAAEEHEVDRGREHHRWSAHVGTGFTADPDGFLLAAGLDYEVARGLRIGPLLQLSLDEDVTLFAPTLNFRYGFDLSRIDDDLSRLEPFVQGGLGLLYADIDRGPGRDDAEFMMNGGGGIEYWIDPRFSLGSSVLFNGTPGANAAGQSYFFSWQLVTARVRF